jgi:hypothetical protein
LDRSGQAYWPLSEEVPLIRSRFVVSAPAFGVLALASTAFAAGPYLKLRAEKAAGDKPVKLTLTAVSGRTLTLPAPVVAVDEGKGFEARPDLACGPAEGTPVTPDKAATSSCELNLAASAKTRVRLEYKLADGIARTNAVTVEAKTAAVAAK